jgi:hypothetical protein
MHRKRPINRDIFITSLKENPHPSNRRGINGMIGSTTPTGWVYTLVITSRRDSGKNVKSVRPSVYITYNYEALGLWNPRLLNNECVINS